MKKINYVLLLLIFATVFSFSACKKQDEKPETKPQKTVEQPQTPSESEFYTKIMQNTHRPVAVMIDNDDEKARPQLGLESAYLVYEIIVEGGSSRFMALFNDLSIDKVGPVRSSRHYFLDYAMENDAIYAHCGYSPQAARDIKNFGINNINGVIGSDGSMFWRDNTYDRSWHNLYTSPKKLAEFAKTNKGYRTDSDVKLLEYSKNDTDFSGDTANKIFLGYSNRYKVSYEYDAQNKNYIRYVNGKQHMSQTGNALTAKNIIVYQVSNYLLNDGENKGRQTIENIGSGTGIYFTDGKAVNINWNKPSRNAKTVYTLSDGSNLVLNPGNTFIQIVPKNQSVSYEQ